MAITRQVTRLFLAIFGAMALSAIVLGWTPAQATGPSQAALGTSTPQVDGSIEHVVAAGETLWTIAAIYNVDLNELLALNGYTDTPLLLEGDRVLIQPPHTPTPTDAPEPTETQTFPPPTATATLPATDLPPTATETPAAAPAPSEFPIANILIVAGAVLVIAGLGLAIRELRGQRED